MPVLAENEALVQNNNYNYSGVNPKLLESAAEQTLVSLVVDVSGSTVGFRPDMEKALGEALLACSLSPRADNLMVRVTRFSDDEDEVQGFTPLRNCQPDFFNGLLGNGGGIV